MLAPAAFAVQFDVTRFDDPVPDGCSSGVDCSLREAIETANATPGGDVVNAPAPPAGQNYELEAGQLTILDNLTLTGGGASTTTIDANALGRVIMIGESGRAPEVEINGVTITGGSARTGGGIRLFLGQLVLRHSVVAGNQAFDETQNGQGGGLMVEPESTAFVENTTFRNNTARKFAGEGGAGGAIWNEGTLGLHKSTIGPGNTAEGGGGPSESGAEPGLGAGVGNSSGVVSIFNSTVSGNAIAGDLSGQGGGVYTNLSGHVTIANSTLAENAVRSPEGAGGNVATAFGGTVSIDHTLLAGGSAASGRTCSGSVTSEGHNLESPTSECGLNSGLFDQGAVANPLLGPLADNDGETQTHALLEGSPAVDAGGTTCPPPDTDQRGLVRAQGSACDIGAFELQQGPNLADPVGPDPDICDGRTATIVGDKGDDVLMGTPGDDVIVSRTGNDQVLGLAGDDVICTRGTADVLKGGSGDDVLRSDGGEDTLRGGGGNDKLHGANEADDLAGGGGNDRVHGGGGNDDLDGGAGDDECFGNGGDHDQGRRCERESSIP